LDSTLALAPHPSTFPFFVNQLLLKVVSFCPDISLLIYLLWKPLFKAPHALHVHFPFFHDSSPSPAL
jgi:hypothetical protein